MKYFTSKEFLCDWVAPATLGLLAGYGFAALAHWVFYG